MAAFRRRRSPLISISNQRQMEAALKEIDLVFKTSNERPTREGVIRVTSIDPLMIAASSGDHVTTRIFLAHGANSNVHDEEGWAPLHHAAYFNNIRVLLLLLPARGVNVNLQAKKQWRPIDLAASATAARALLDAGAHIGPPAGIPGGLSPLHHAAIRSHHEVVDTLLASGARVDAQTTALDSFVSFGNHSTWGGTPLHFCCISLAASRGQSSKDFKPDTKVTETVSFGNVFPGLVHAPDAVHKRVALLSSLLRAGADPNARTTRDAHDKSGPLPDENTPFTPLHLAAISGDAALIPILIRAGAEVEAEIRPSWRTPLFCAAEHGHTDCIYALVAGGAAVDRPCHINKKESITPLIAAVERGHASAVTALLELGADDSIAQYLRGLGLAYPIEPRVQAILARHQAGRNKPQRVCSLPSCEARRRLDFDDMSLKACPCSTQTFYCCVDHQAADRKRHKAACKAGMMAVRASKEAAGSGA
jgi:ankyrin repeat protein